MAGFNKFRLSMAMIALAIGLAGAAPTMPLDECRRLAAEGDAEAQWQLGQRYENGDGVKQNAMSAIGQYRKAADQGHREACAKLASYYESGTLVGKNPALAAKYRAMANGEDPEVAVADAKATARAKKYDEVEVALDYIIGRNGKEKDPKTGIRLLYSSAKDNPDAQRVFCEAWYHDALDLSALDRAEWALVIPWFRDAFNSGMKTCGLVLGNDAYDKGQYQAAIQYWTAAGNAGVGKAWYHLGLFYDPTNSDGNFRAPKALLDERKAKYAFEKSSKIRWGGQEDALFNMGLICLYSKSDDCRDYARALSIFEEILEKHPGEASLLYSCGYAGIMHINGTTLEMLETITRQLRQPLMPAERRGLQRQRDNLRSQVNSVVRGKYRKYIKTAADVGYEPAQKFLNYLDMLLQLD